MADDSVARARAALKRAQAAAQVGPDGAAAPIVEAIDQIALELDRLTEVGRNLALQQALLDQRLLRVERSRLFTAVNQLVSGVKNVFTRIRTGIADGRAPDEENDPSAYAGWVGHESAAFPSRETALAASQSWTVRPAISILTTARTPHMLAPCFEAVCQQAYDNWELCVAASEAALPQLTKFPGRLLSVKADSLGEAQALNAAASLATGEFLAILPETGVLSPPALYYVVEALQGGELDVLYSDEDLLDAEQRRVNPRFKPDWSPELLTSTMYLGNLLVIRRECWLHAGGLSPDSGDAYLHDLVLRLADGPARVRHIPRVLYHGLTDAPASQDGGSAIERAIERREGTEAVCSPGPRAGTWITRRKRATPQMTAIVCSRSPTLLETCLASLRSTAEQVIKDIVVVAHEEFCPNAQLRAVIQRAGATSVSYTGVFQFAVMNNIAVRQAASPNLLFLNDDVRATEDGWAELLAQQVSRPEVGVAGAVLWYPTGMLQHAGVVAGIGDGVGHTGRYQRGSQLWPWLLATREVSAVTGACMAIRKDLFEQVGGFDPLFPNNYNDVDLCFRIRSSGYRVLCVPAPGLVHAECQSRPGVVRFEERYRFYERWGQLLRNPDPYYSRSLARGERIELNMSDDSWPGVEGIA